MRVEFVAFALGVLLYALTTPNNDSHAGAQELRPAHVQVADHRPNQD